METDDIQLLQATVDDIPNLLKVLHAAFEEYRGKLDPPSGAHDETIDTLREKLKTGYAAKALLNTEIVGCVFYEVEGTHIDLSRLSVLPQHRNQGIGGALINYVEEQARRLQVPSVQLGVRLVLPKLMKYYERLGYRVIEYRTHEGYTEPTYVVMEKAVLSGTSQTG